MGPSKWISTVSNAHTVHSMQSPGETIGSRPRAHSEAGWDIQRLFNTIRMSSSSPSCSGDAPAVSHLLGRRAKNPCRQHALSLPLHAPLLLCTCQVLRYHPLLVSSLHQPLFVCSAPVSLPNEPGAQSQKCRSTSAVAVLRPPSERFSAHALRRRRQSKHGPCSQPCFCSGQRVSHCGHLAPPWTTTNV